MHAYIENPKTKGSGIICCIPQRGICPVQCPDCFFQAGRSYLEPLDKHLPNMPSREFAKGMVVRVNDGNDSNNRQEEVISAVQKYPERFYNTSIPRNLEKFDAPVVLTVNPGDLTDSDACLLAPVPYNLMFVRVRVNTWNLDLVDRVVEHYTSRNIPVILTFMAYYSESVPAEHKENYSWRQRTMNSYWVITPEAWDKVMARYAGNELVHSCGKDANTFACSQCLNCLREYYLAKERMKAHLKAHC